MNDFMSADFGASYGIDGCKVGWVIASVNSAHSVSFEVSRSLTALFACARQRGFTIAIDIPLGFRKPDQEFVTNVEFARGGAGLPGGTCARVKTSSSSNSQSQEFIVFSRKNVSRWTASSFDY